MNIIEQKTFDQERALYGSKDLLVRDCAFDGPADGESALKECRNIQVENCFLNLRYPFWHNHGLTIRGSELTELCRAALWYSEDLHLENTKFHGIKALRECKQVRLDHCDIRSPEFGWSVSDIEMNDCDAVSEYFMLRCDHMRFRDVRMQGKYSFQYLQDAVFEHCTFDTKDAFWHANHVIVRDSVVKGEYLAWYSENVTFERCTIIGTQPLCYCKNLRLIDCKMIDTDLCFEKSQVQATITTSVQSIKNPLSGKIVVPAVGEIVRDDPESCGEIVVTGEETAAI